jgi:DNA-directed RNA polymerase subunit K/omega
MRDISSRSDQLNLDKCVENIGGNRFVLVIAAAVKAREMSKNRYSELRENIYPGLSALLSIQDGNIDDTWVRKVI